MGMVPSIEASANSRIALAFDSEQPAERSSAFLSSVIFSALNDPPHNASTLVMMVAAALVESCWERMEEASDEKLLSRTRGDFSLTPMVQKPDRSITISKRGLSEIIFRAAVLDCASEISTAQKVAVRCALLRSRKVRHRPSHFQFCSLFLAAYRDLQRLDSDFQNGGETVT